MIIFFNLEYAKTKLVLETPSVYRHMDITYIFAHNKLLLNKKFDNNKR